jgi:hypothetical protein
MRQSEQHIRKENEILKRLLKDGYFLMNFDSRDCDGCYKSSVVKFESLEELYEEEESCAEWADGSFSFSLPIRLQDGSLDLNEEFIGGQW